MVQWLMLPACQVKVSGFVPRSCIQNPLNQMFLRFRIVGSLCDQEVSWNLEFCILRVPHHPQEVLAAQFSLYVNKGGPMPHLSLHYSRVFDISVILQVMNFLILHHSALNPRTQWVVTSPQLILYP